MTRSLLDLMLLLSVVVVALTGLLVDRLDLNEFRLHPLAGYVMTVLVIAHVVLHRRSLLAIVGPRRRDRAQKTTPPGEQATVDAVDLPSQTDLDRDPGLDLETARSRGGHPAGLGASPRLRGSRRTVLTSLAAGVAGSVAGWVTRSEVAPNPYPGGDVGLFYHRESSLGVRGLLSNLLDWGSRPPRYKEVVTNDPIELPSVSALPVMSVAQALQERRSRREYADRAMTTEELAWMVRSATGITADGGYRTTPSAGALYPIETYVAVNRVDGIEPGLYHVDVRSQSLQPVRTGSVGGDLMVAGLGQDFLRTASAVFVLSGYFQRTRWKYHERHYRYVCWEAGHVAQNLYLAGEAAGLGVCVVGAFFDGALNDLLRLDGREEAALGFIAVGPR